MMHGGNPQPMSGGQEEKNKSSGYCFTLIGFLICIIMSVIISIYGFYIYSKVSEYDHSVDELISNWKSNPIVDIQISNSTCPAGYEALITGGWPGTVEGCECSKSWNPLFKGLSRNQCANADSKNGCFKILPQKPIDCQKFYSYTICGKREGQNFINTKRPSGSGANTTCPTGYKVCGKGNVNTNYCTSTNSSCPITDIYIGNPNSTVQPGYKALPLGNGRYAAFKSEGNDLPIVRFKITEGNVCVDPYQQMKSENRTIYKLMNDTYGECEAKVAGNSTDPQYVQIGSIKENILFDDNNVTNVIKNLPNYPVNDSAKYDWNLFYARYFQWNVECEIKHNIDRKEMAELIDNSDDIPDLQWKTLFLIGLQAIMVSFVMEILGIFIACCCPSCKQIYEVIWLIIKLVLLGAIGYYIYKCIKLVGVYKSSIQTIMDTDCSSTYVNSMLDAYGESQLGSRCHNYILGGLVIVAGLISIIFVFLEYRRK